MEIIPNGTQSSIQGPEECFTGTVRIDPLFMESKSPSKVSGASVTFEPCARTAWHTHPLGQVLIITAGCGLAQSEGNEMQTIRSGDIVRFAPNEKHWHGASPSTSMTHIAVQEELSGSAVTWLEKVSDEQYARSSK